MNDSLLALGLKEDMPGQEHAGLRKYVLDDILRSVQGTSPRVEPPPPPGGGPEFPVFKLMVLDFFIGQVVIGPLITTCWRGAWISFNSLLDDHLFKVGI